ncbi:MAG TPA: Lar family restriction alleviation protein [Dongiaceae bacterium]|nr:Lar family restriction alleviation protein [Dongiaceae bacterium]
MADLVELKPCPFDAGEPCVQHKGDTVSPLIFVWCPRCGTHGPSRATEAESITAWNTRPDEIEHLTARKVVGPSREEIRRIMFDAGEDHFVGDQVTSDGFNKIIDALNEAGFLALLETKA